MLFRVCNWNLSHGRQRFIGPLDDGKPIFKICEQEGRTGGICPECLAEWKRDWKQRMAKRRTKNEVFLSQRP